MQKCSTSLLMKTVNIKQQFRNVISFFAIVGLLSMTSVVVLPIGKAHAITSSPVLPSNINTISSLGISASPFFESNVSITPQIEHTGIKGFQNVTNLIENGTIKGVGYVTNSQIWTDASRLIKGAFDYGVGHGVITTADGQNKATWIGYGVGRSNVNGTITYHDVIFFNTNSTGKLAFLKNLEGLHISEVDGKKRTTKIYEWK
jgi:hypothetical protein